MGLFKFFKKFFGVSEPPINKTKQSDITIVPSEMEPSASTQKPEKKPFHKKGQSKPIKQSWQMHGNKITRETDIVIGFDFGTACTKVIIQDGVLKKAYAVPFDGVACVGNRYLLPTVVSVTRDGNISLEQNGELIKALKIKFLKKPDESFALRNGVALTPAEATSAYIGLVLQKIREWFWIEKLYDYKGVKVNWQLNIGMASRSYDDIALKNQMQRVALAGWNLTLNTVKKINVREVKLAMENAKHQLSENIFDEEAQQLHPGIVCPVPEIIAHVVGYARSPMRQDGMYLIIDVGASTIDVSNFILHKKDGEDLYTILVAEVEMLGASILHRHRIACAEKVIKKYMGVADAEIFMQKARKTIGLRGLLGTPIKL